MRGIFLSKIFRLGFLGSFVVLFVLIFRSSSSSDFRDNSRSICFDCYEAYGFPFVMHEYGTILHIDRFVWSGVIANLTIAIISSIVFGVGFTIALRTIYKRLGFPR